MNIYIIFYKLFPERFFGGPKRVLLWHCCENLIVYTTGIEWTYITPHLQLIKNALVVVWGGEFPLVASEDMTLIRILFSIFLTHWMLEPCHMCHVD